MQQNTLLDEAKSHFDHWRTTRAKRSKIPENLWDKVKPLINHYPLTEITKALNINTNQIREYLNIDNNIHFVEAKTESSFSSSSKQKLISVCAEKQTCSIELYRVNGCVLKISAISTASLSAIIAQFIV